ncbi:hypothetical protein D918_06295 [Trichuris suis]|nr:hypothetical protein D918_06295 [Trichuris suis]
MRKLANKHVGGRLSHRNKLRRRPVRETFVQSRQVFIQVICLLLFLLYFRRELLTPPKHCS